MTAHNFDSYLFRPDKGKCATRSLCRRLQFCANTSIRSSLLTLFIQFGTISGGLSCVSPYAIRMKPKCILGANSPLSPSQYWRARAVHTNKKNHDIYNFRFSFFISFGIDFYLPLSLGNENKKPIITNNTHTPDERCARRTFENEPRFLCTDERLESQIQWHWLLLLLLLSRPSLALPPPLVLLLNIVVLLMRFGSSFTVCFWSCLSEYTKYKPNERYERASCAQLAIFFSIIIIVLSVPLRRSGHLFRMRSLCLSFWLACGGLFGIVIVWV